MVREEDYGGCGVCGDGEGLWGGLWWGLMAG